MFCSWLGANRLWWEFGGLGQTPEVGIVWNSGVCQPGVCFHALHLHLGWNCGYLFTVFQFGQHQGFGLGMLRLECPPSRECGLSMSVCQEIHENVESCDPRHDGSDSDHLWSNSFEKMRGVNERLKQASGQAKLFNSREAWIIVVTCHDFAGSRRLLFFVCKSTHWVLESTVFRLKLLSRDSVDKC